MPRANKLDIEIILNEERVTTKKLNEILDSNLRILKEEERVVICLLCDKVRTASKVEFSRIKNEMRTHVESHIDDLYYICNKCDKVLKTRSTFYCHMSKDH